MKNPLKAVRTFINKVKDQAGDTFAETLVALLIAALGTAALVTMVATSTNIVSSSKTAMDKGYASEISVATEENIPTLGTVVISGNDLQATVITDVEVYASDTFYRYESES